ncbi:hypothetical protein BHM03_00008133 [Ensete ventricosum]|nr:hypothetical protein BHM03_00008133 [Ensete ventricosum]
MDDPSFDSIRGFIVLMSLFLQVLGRVVSFCVSLMARLRQVSLLLLGFRCNFLSDSVIAWFSQWTDIRNWICNIEQHASNNVNKILVGNKADMDESKRACVLLVHFSLLAYDSSFPVHIFTQDSAKEDV